MDADPRPAARALRSNRRRPDCSRGSRRCSRKIRAARDSPSSRRSAGRVPRSSLVLTPAPQGHSGLRRRLPQPLWVLLAATAVLLGLACLNVAGLFLARGSARDREIGTRLALGASRGRISRQLIADSLLLALAGGSLGLLLAPVAMRTLIAFLPSGSNGIAIGHRLAPAAVRVPGERGRGILSGLAPAWQAARRSLASSLRERGGTGLAGVRLRKTIVTVQIALTLTLVIGAALFVRTFDALMAKGPGFATSSLVSFRIDPRRNGYSQPEGARLIRRIEDAIRVSPITQTSAVARVQLLTGGSWNDPMTIRRTNEFRRIATSTECRYTRVLPDDGDRISPDGTSTSAIPARRVTPACARRLSTKPSSSDTWKGATRSACAFARARDRMRSRTQRLSAWCPTSAIAACARNRSRPTSRSRATAVARSTSGFAGTRSRAPIDSHHCPERRSDVADHVLPDAGRSGQPVVEYRAHAGDALLQLRLLALLLSLVGLYGVMSFVVTQRTREIGIRLALGATRRSAIWLVLRDALAMILAGNGDRSAGRLGVGQAGGIAIVRCAAIGSGCHRDRFCC